MRLGTLLSQFLRVFLPTLVILIMKSYKTMRIIYFFHPTETLVSLAKQKKRKSCAFSKKGFKAAKLSSLMTKEIIGLVWSMFVFLNIISALEGTLRPDFTSAS